MPTRRIGLAAAIACALTTGAGSAQAPQQPRTPRATQAATLVVYKSPT